MIYLSDIPGFETQLEKLSKDNYIFCDYFFETSEDPKWACASLCSEATTAQWVSSKSTEDLRNIYGAKFFNLKIEGEFSTPLYPQPWIQGSRFFRCHMTMALPLINLNGSLAVLLSTLAGEGAFYCPGLTTVKLLDLHFPSSYLKLFKGPPFGIKGLRDYLKIYDRPFFIGVVKPNLGLKPADFSTLAFESWLGGLDIAKDDEMFTDVQYNPLIERLTLCAQKMKEAIDFTGQKKMMIANFSASYFSLLSDYHSLTKLGVNGFMINTFFSGFSALQHLCHISTHPVMGHFTGMALWDRMPHFGIEGSVLIKLQRLAGADMIVFPGFGDRMQTTPEIVLKNIQACLAPMGSISPSLPVPGGSDWAGSLPFIFNKLKNVDFGFIAGRGIYDHPMGPQGGAQSLHQAWEAISKEEKLSDYVQNNSGCLALKSALDYFGKKKT
ncbi:MAG: hypothetical protein A3G32_10110 [Deltaproteobacteria bacterium RIFCSPLOWO2_12_FULL_40_28]|nr:MAG: hypothetical protein A3C45_05120 [Deltaproteobacteria bacterium RIFCSPHIGHO2_02_FULL_40_28]OGQ20383.1 MAG: hypothetical protein A3E27_00500 [Deltaproteobacteria bacterium RIFCSPHIGHO2_12_FULL_40_32]OGQ41352.1 MAG: hypothetical protein A3I69_02150 [Deltaproteobacteria bacterium RIFCSPLOWO2_02_FULL_40_36]OGQ54991.1 MAG: hypothetical protein A3G32_10110 [Deltaproteobacteria bacterium RIFCSPLOWO2_12_FULL_40_28]